MISSLLLKKASFAFIMEAKQINTELYFSAGAKFNGSDWPCQTVFVENIYS